MLRKVPGARYLARMRHDHMARLSGVLELGVIALAARANPALSFQSLDDRRAVHGV
jgi:hypothetical protein